jgi:uncharacterized membrane protein YbjE (DUF340 family)
MSLLIILSLAFGMVLGSFFFFPEGYLDVTQLLVIQLFFVGMVTAFQIHDLRWHQVFNRNFVLFPLLTILGTFFGVTVVSLCFGFDLSRTLMVSSGLGYYSLSSILVSQWSTPEWGLLAFVVNFIREILTLVFIPILFRCFGANAPIASAGATSADTVLPLITRICGADKVLLSVVSGIILTLLVPVLIGLWV